MTRPLTDRERCVAARAKAVTRYVVTHVNRDLDRVMTYDAQGRHTFATEEEAAELARAIETNNAPDRLRVIYGAQAIGTFAARACECWPGHFDPCGVYFAE